jgi:hypothetical protein
VAAADVSGAVVSVGIENPDAEPSGVLAARLMPTATVVVPATAAMTAHEDRSRPIYM